MTLLSSEGIAGNPISYPDYDDWTHQTKNFTSITATRNLNFSLLQGDIPERVRGMRATPNLLTTLGIEPEVGRGFRPEEGVNGNEFVAMLTHEFWTSHFNGSKDVVGKPILLGRVPYVVVGILPPMALPQAAQGGNVPQVVVAFAPAQAKRTRGLLCLRVIGRVRTKLPYRLLWQRCKSSIVRLSTPLPRDTTKPPSSSHRFAIGLSAPCVPWS